MNAAISVKPSPSEDEPRKVTDRQAVAAEPPKTANVDSGNAPEKAQYGHDKWRSSTGVEGGEALGKLDRPSEVKNYNFSGTFFGLSFGDAHHAEKRLTWPMALRRIEPSECYAGRDVPDAVFNAACAVWTTQRIIVLRHQQGALDRAERLLYRLALWANEHDPSLKLMGTANDVVLPLGDLASDEAWPADSHGALVLVQRRQDPKTTLFLCSNNGVGVKGLQERLQARNSRLLISVAAEWDAAEGRLDPFDKSVRTLEVTAVGQRASAARTSDDESSFDAVPRIVASLFEGIGVQEFQSLVDDLLVGIAAPESAPVVATAPDPAHSFKLTRHQRWLTGDVDRVLAELGVRYLVAPTESGLLPGQLRSVGYCLTDPSSPYAESGWVIAHHPALLGRRADSLLDRYLVDDIASNRYREAFRPMLARLDEAGVCTVSADWLMSAWQRALARQVHPGLIGERLFSVVEYLSSDCQGSEPQLALQLINALAADVVASELTFQVELGLQPLRKLFPRTTDDDLIAPIEVWQRLRAVSAASSAIGTLEYRQITSLWALMLLARRWPRAVAIALARVLDESSAADTPWRQAAVELPALNAVARYASLALHYLLALAACEEPAVWTAVADGVIQAFKDDAQASMSTTTSRAVPASGRGRAVWGQRLAFLCIYALVPQIETKERSDSLLCRLDLLSEAERRKAGDDGLIGRLLAMAHLSTDDQPMLGPAGAGTLPVADIVRFLRAIALELQADEDVTATKASDLLLAIAAGLRAVLPRQQRRALLGQARESLESQQLTRDEFEAEDNLDMVRLVRRRIRATQLVLRSLSAG
jgi:hypothetical protein